jgi:hypothetical protein
VHRLVSLFLAIVPTTSVAQPVGVYTVSADPVLADPSNQGWGAGVFAVDPGDPPTMGLVDDGGTLAWEIDTFSNGSGVGDVSDLVSYQRLVPHLAAAQALATGWRLDARIRVVASFSGRPDLRNAPVQLAYFADPSVFGVRFLTDGDDLLITTCDFEDVPGCLAVLPGGALRYVDVTLGDFDANGEADVWVDGVRLLTDVDPRPTGATPRVNFGDIAQNAGAEAEGTFRLVRLALRTFACPSDVAPPFGELTFGDTSAFITAFQMQDPAADIAEPFGVFTFGDISAFLFEFTAGCP